MRPQPNDRAVRPARPWRAWYSTKEWRALRAKRLHIEPHCRFCAEAGRLIFALAVDHITAHRGNARLFFDFKNTQSLCGPCEERLGYSTKIGADGLPTDPRHPFNKG